LACRKDAAHAFTHGEVDRGGRVPSTEGLRRRRHRNTRVLALPNRLKRQGVVDLVIGYQPAVVAIDCPVPVRPADRPRATAERQLARSICGIRWIPDACRVWASRYYAWIREA